ncbi:MAG: hypothetical protein HQL11_00310, partial [Candidatus Omnitrophica bacterium]|nr:hypothetical protein [Candidatus Omnitrophota bacterium]
GGAHGIYVFEDAAERAELMAMFEKYEVDFVLQGHYHAYVDQEINGVRYITSGSFTDGLLDEGLRHFLVFKVLGPEVRVEMVPVLRGGPVEYRDGEI